MSTKNTKKEEVSSDKSKNLASAINQIESQFGSGTIMRMGDKKVEDIPSISTGSLGLDLALGVMGLPRGRVVEIFGPESSGKTLSLIHISEPTRPSLISYAVFCLKMAARREKEEDYKAKIIQNERTVHAEPFYLSLIHI